MTRYTPQWLQAGVYGASADRRLIGALWPQARCQGCQVHAATGMGLTVDPGQVAVPSPNNTGTTLCSSDAPEPVTITAAPPTGQERYDLVVIQARGADLDGGANNDFVFAAVAGVAAVPPAVVPAVPAGAVALAQVHIAGGVAAIVAGDIVDLRPSSLYIPPQPAAYDPASAPLTGWQDHARGSLNAGTSDGGTRALPAPPWDGNVFLMTGGNHGYGSAASASSYTVKRQTPAANLIGSVTINVPAAMTHALPTLFWGPGPISKGEIWNLFITVTITGSNNYFSPKVGYIITPR